MVLLLFREYSCLLTKNTFFLVLGYLGNLFSWVCVEDQIRTKWVMSFPWVFYSGWDSLSRSTVAQWGHCFWQVTLGKSLGLCCMELLQDQFQRPANTLKWTNLRSPIDRKCGPGKRMNIFGIWALFSSTGGEPRFGFGWWLLFWILLHYSFN